MRERDRERMGMSKEWSAGISSPDVGISYSLHTYCLTKALCVGPSCSRLKLKAIVRSLSVPSTFKPQKDFSQNRTILVKHLSEHCVAG